MRHAVGPSAINFVVNGQPRVVEAERGTALLHVLRNDLALNGPKYGCGLGECGACTVLIDGRLARSCIVPFDAVEGCEVTTLEGLGSRDALSPVQAAFVQEQAAQCGYCLNGMILTAHALLAANPRPTDAEIRHALRFNLCRCGTHVEILKAVRAASAMIGPET